VCLTFASSSWLKLYKIRPLLELQPVRYDTLSVSVVLFARITTGTLINNG
jgi:hypothetical protein